MVDTIRYIPIPVAIMITDTVRIAVRILAPIPKPLVV